MESSDLNLVCGHTGVVVSEATLLYEGHLACQWLILFVSLNLYIHTLLILLTMGFFHSHLITHWSEKKKKNYGHLSYPRNIFSKILTKVLHSGPQTLRVDSQLW